MQTVFLSYAHEDIDDAHRLEQQLVAKGVTVWRDDQLRAGQNWPKALGEKIAASDSLLLLWSGRSAVSTFVELEWCTALALGKTIFPCVVDDTPLPPSLSAIQAIRLDIGAEAAMGIVTAQANETIPADQTRTKQVISQLADVPAVAPGEVLRKVKAAFSEQLNVQGPVNIYLAPATPPWKTRVFISLAVLIVMALGIQLARSILATRSAATEEQTREQSIAGSIWDEDNEPIPGAQVSLLLGDKVIASGNTDPLGHFTFRVKAQPEADVTLIAQKEHYHTEKRYAHLGNPGFNFKMRRNE